ncbi:hypothetical protein AXYL_04006 [Achromobacter xylosoxidans A8]|uniref:Uncharacterized protein n=1 Tax=Achromobacter xylosoxidans (strain A8) TaxID=762376 RepID=E3HSK9_ACHXA|nr:hypothetical protein AXYL_04006 [Achromobacter xylosoxidans A8]
MFRARDWTRAGEVWEGWGEVVFLTVAYLFVGYQVLVGTDAYALIRILVIQHEHFQLAEVLLLSAMAFPVACIVLFIQLRRLQLETRRRRALDARITELFKRVRDARLGEISRSNL